MNYLLTGEEMLMDALRTATKKYEMDASMWAMGDDDIMNEGCGASARWERMRSSVVVLRIVWSFVGCHGSVVGLG